MNNSSLPTKWRLVWPKRKKQLLWAIPVLVIAVYTFQTLWFSSKASSISSYQEDAAIGANQQPARKMAAPKELLKEKGKEGNKHDDTTPKEVSEKSLKQEETRKEKQINKKNDDDSAASGDGHDLEQVKTSKTKAKQNDTSSQHKLRFDWTNLHVQSPLAKDMLAHQANCSLPLGNYKSRNRFGLGSDLHVWGQGLCNAFEAGVRVRSELPWIFWDEEACQDYADKKSAMICYFPGSELNCPGDVETSKKGGIEPPISYSNSGGCKGFLSKYGEVFGIPEIRAAGIEYLFRQISPVLLKEAERQLNLVFPDGVPEGLITVHMRWGDKKHEMKLRKVGEYIKAVKKILKQRKMSEDEAHIFLATEDPEALRQFTEEMPKGWEVYVDQFYTEMLPYRIDEYNGNPKMSRKLRGKTGLIALGSLLVSVESNFYVLTTASNWSRLMNEIRKNVIDPRCNNCTIMIDLKSGEW